MPTFNVGDKVQVKPPFSESFPDSYTVLALSQAADTYSIDVWNDGVGSDFYIDFLQAAI